MVGEAAAVDCLAMHCTDRVAVVIDIVGDDVVDCSDSSYCTSGYTVLHGGVVLMLLRRRQDDLQNQIR